MAYDVYFVGLICFIDEGDAYLAALPNATNLDDPCRECHDIHPHYPYLIVESRHIVNSGNVDGRFVSRCFVLELSNYPDLNFDHATTGTLDKHELGIQGYSWSDIDADFEINAERPDNMITSLPIGNGIIRPRVLPNTRAQITWLTVPVSPPHDSFCIRNGDELLLEVSTTAEIVIANVGEEWIDDLNYDDDDNHFFAYYSLGKVDDPTCILPTDNKAVPDASGQHPFISGDRGLRVACSNTTYP